MHLPELLSVRQAWSKMDHSSWQGQQRAAPTLDLVTALRMAHDEAQASVLWPTPQEEQEGRSHLPFSGHHGDLAAVRARSRG